MQGPEKQFRAKQGRKKNASIPQLPTQGFWIIVRWLPTFLHWHFSCCLPGLGLFSGFTPSPLPSKLMLSLGSQYGGCLLDKSVPPEPDSEGVRGFQRREGVDFLDLRVGLGIWDAGLSF